MSTVQAPKLTNEHSRDTTALSITSTVCERASPPTSEPPITYGDTSKKILNSIDTDVGSWKKYEMQTPATPIRPLRHIIPAGHRHRTLVVCFDGTGDQFDNDNSNVVQFVSLLKKDDKDKQLVYYQAGIGTYNSPKIASPALSKLKLILDIMFASSLDAHVMSGYEFLMQNYVPKDKISIFGFSRGALTARCLAGILDRIGLLPAGNFQQVPFLYQMYKRDDVVGQKQASEFKKAFSLDVTIDFLGVWDTVESIGFKPTRLPFASSDSIIRIFRHALALDERRAKFKADMWHRPSKKDNIFKTKATNSDENRQSQPTHVEEVWFAGCHCDVGGGSVSNATRYSLARIPLRWMVRECFKVHTGILFYSDKLREIGLDPDKLCPYPAEWTRPDPLPIGHHKIRNMPQEPIPIQVEKFLRWDQANPAVPQEPLGSEEEEELHDALSPKYCQLKLMKWWYLLEWMYLPFRYQTAHPDNDWKIEWGFNNRKPREIPNQEEEAMIHRSVQIRMSAEHEDDGRWRWPWKKYEPKKYEPKAQLPVHMKWVD